MWLYFCFFVVKPSGLIQVNCQRAKKETIFGVAHIYFAVKLSKTIRQLGEEQSVTESDLVEFEILLLK